MAKENPIIVPVKFSVQKIKSRNVNPNFLKIYHKVDVQTILLQETNVEKTVPYFLCGNYTTGEHLFIVGSPKPNLQKLFYQVARGEEGFNENEISIGECFILDENGKKTLCLYPNRRKSSGNKATAIKILKELSFSKLKKFRWLTSPLMVDAQDPSKVESTVDENQEHSFQINQEAITKKADILEGYIEKLNKDIKIRYERKEVVANDATFVKEVRKAGHLFLAQLARTDEDTIDNFSSLKKEVEEGLPEWKKLEAKIYLNSNKSEMVAFATKSLQKVMKTMDERKSEIDTILKRVNPEALS